MRILGKAGAVLGYNLVALLGACVAVLRTAVKWNNSLSPMVLEAFFGLDAWS